MVDIELTISISLLNTALSAVLAVFFLHKSRLQDYRKMMLVALFAFTAIASLLVLIFSAPFAVLTPVVGLLLLSLTFSEWFEDKWLKPIALAYFAFAGLSLIAAFLIGFTVYTQLGDLRMFIALVLSMITIALLGRTYLQTWDYRVLVFFISVVFFMTAALMAMTGYEWLGEYMRIVAYVTFAVPFILK